MGKLWGFHDYRPSLFRFGYSDKGHEYVLANDSGFEVDLGALDLTDEQYEKLSDALHDAFTEVFNKGLACGRIPES
jgi:hypothetical protein